MRASSYRLVHEVSGLPGILLGAGEAIRRTEKQSTPIFHRQGMVRELQTIPKLDMQTCREGGKPTNRGRNEEKNRS